mmetsp:Transcript_12010/g.22969  ORF Transcript_12010/g.22969 Transcript_12010/m.22969 type:complete len:382 (-) Transcript_12010:639-1784(-)
MVGSARQGRAMMKVDNPPLLPSRRSRKESEDENDESTLFVVSTSNMHDDDVSLLSFDQCFPSQNHCPKDEIESRFGRFSSVHKDCDVSPMPPRRRLGSSARSLNPSLRDLMIHTTTERSSPTSSSPTDSSCTRSYPSESSSHTSSSPTDSSPSGSSCTRSSPSDSSTATRSSSKDSVSLQLDSILGMVNNLGMQLSAIQRPNQSPEIQTNEEIRLLRQQLEEERRARQNIEKKLTVERDVATTIKAQLALKNAVNAMTEHIQLIQQDQRETARARQALMDVVGEFGEGRWRPISYQSLAHNAGRNKSKKATRNSICYTIPELEAIPSEYDSSSVSRASSSSRGSSSHVSTKSRKSTRSSSRKTSTNANRSSSNDNNSSSSK